MGLSFFFFIREMMTGFFFFSPLLGICREPFTFEANVGTAGFY